MSMSVSGLQSPGDAIVQNHEQAWQDRMQSRFNVACAVTGIGIGILAILGVSWVAVSTLAALAVISGPVTLIAVGAIGGISLVATVTVLIALAILIAVNNYQVKNDDQMVKEERKRFEALNQAI